MSQGDLSNRVHFLKCEEGGFEAMCEMSEKQVEEERAEGERNRISSCGSWNDAGEYCRYCKNEHSDCEAVLDGAAVAR